MPNFNAILDKKMDTIEKPKLVPPGTYKGMVTKVPSIERSPDGKWDFLDFNLRLTEAGSDVDEAALASYGGLGSHSNMRRRFLFNTGDTTEDKAGFDRTQYDVKRFLVDHLKCAKEDTSLKEGLNNSVNQSCMVVVKWRADKQDPDIMYSEINKTTAIAE